MTYDEQKKVKALWKKHGGKFYGPRVEHADIKETAFYDFCEELMLEARTITYQTRLGSGEQQ